MGSERRSRGGTLARQGEECEVRCKIRAVPRSSALAIRVLAPLARDLLGSLQGCRATASLAPFPVAIEISRAQRTWRDMGARQPRAVVPRLSSLTFKSPRED